MPKIIVVTGLQGSGKTRFALDWLMESPATRSRVNYDELRILMYGAGWKWNRAEEDKMKEGAQLIAENNIKAGLDVIIDNTNLTRAARKPWMNMAKDFKCEYSEVEMDTPVAECVARDRARSGAARVGRALIERNALFYGYIDWSDLEVYPRDFIVVDLDGTTADCEWRRKLALEGPTKHKQIVKTIDGIPAIKVDCPDPTNDRQCPTCGGKSKKDWKLFMSNVENDPPIKPIIDLATTLAGHHDQGLDVLIVSGRAMDVAGMGTETWIENNLSLAFPVKHLFMRNRGDYRDDVIVKQEILDLLPKDRIKYVLDDRDGVVAMWRKNGLTCLQVANGSF